MIYVAPELFQNIDKTNNTSRYCCFIYLNPCYFQIIYFFNQIITISYSFEIDIFGFGLSIFELLTKSINKDDKDPYFKRTKKKSPNYFTNILNPLNVREIFFIIFLVICLLFKLNC